MRDFTAIERLLLPIVRSFVELWVRPSVLPDGVAEHFASGRPVLYALEKRSVIDVAVLEYVCRERRLPPPLAPLGSRRVLPASCVFLERHTGLFRQRVDRRMPEALRTLNGVAAADLAFDVDIVPVSLFWGRAPGRERSWFRLMVAKGWDIGGPTSAGPTAGPAALRRTFSSRILTVTGARPRSISPASASSR